MQKNVDRKTLLLVEDETLIALGEKIDLEQYGYSVREWTGPSFYKNGV